MYDKKKKNMGGEAFGIRDLLSREASVAWIFRCLQCKDTKIIIVGLIMIADVSTTIHMYQVSRNVEAGGGFWNIEEWHCRMSQSS